jgi:hypothetical protein
MPATTITGACGEHYVAAYLSGCDLIVAMPRAGTPGSDLFVTREKGGSAVRVQVKTARAEALRNDKEVGRIYLWATSYSVIERDDRYLWYAYVWLNGWPEGGNVPEVFFVPSRVVIGCMKECLANKDTRPYFWLRLNDAERYKARAGLESLLEALG